MPKGLVCGFTPRLLSAALIPIIESVSVLSVLGAKRAIEMESDT